LHLQRVDLKQVGDEGWKGEGTVNLLAKRTSS
jgi:hypothetical protein